MQTDPASGARAGGRFAAILRVPLFAKLVVADSALVISAVLAGAALGRAAPAGTDGTLRLIAAAAVAVGLTVAINALIVRLALRPVHMLEAAAAAVAAGHSDARAPISRFADRHLVRVIATFNAALDAAGASRARLRAVAARSLSSAEAERRRVAYELHEGVAQTLAATRLRLRLAHGAREPDLQAAHLESLSAELGRAIDALRDIALELRPQTLDLLGLGAAVETLVESVGHAAGLHTDVIVEPVGSRLGDDVELAVYRILEEAIANVVQHARATTLTVRLRADDSGSVRLNVEDDGCGFAANGPAGVTSALGLAGMQERAAYVGGTVEILSAPGRGTRVEAHIPLADAASPDALQLTA